MRSDAIAANVVEDNPIELLRLCSWEILRGKALEQPWILDSTSLIPQQATELQAEARNLHAIVNPSTCSSRVALLQSHSTHAVHARSDQRAGTEIKSWCFVQ
jgi:hypothetical protein